MAKAHIHAASSAKKWGGEASEYLDIHLLLDASKAAMGDWRHRALTHNTWFISVILPKIFGNTFVNSEGRTVSVVDVGEQHCLEDNGMKFIATPQDYLADLPLAPWMANGGGGLPPSCKGLHRSPAAAAAEGEPEVVKKYTIVD